MGTYSSIFIASPVYLSWQNMIDDRRAKRLNIKPTRQGDSKPQSKAETAKDENEDSTEIASGGTVTRIQNTKKKKRRKK